MWFKRKYAPSYKVGQEIFLSSNDQYRFLDKNTASVLKTGSHRILFVAFVFFVAFSVVMGALFYRTVLTYQPQKTSRPIQMTDIPVKRANITDRNGRIIATSLPTVELYLNHLPLKEPEKMADDIAEVLPDMDKAELTKKITSGKRFQYIKRNLTPTEQFDVNKLGYPQLEFVDGEQRIYPNGSLFSHIIGYTDIDNIGIAGLEKSFNDVLTNSAEPLTLSLDATVQQIIHEELSKAISIFLPEYAVGIVANANNGEILGLVSLPDFDPNPASDKKGDALFNHATLGVFELGSVMKLFTVATAIETGLAKPDDDIDATEPFKADRFMIKDTSKPQKRPLNLAEILIYSSNIASAKLALTSGPEIQRMFLDRFGFFAPLPIDLPERGRPLAQKSNSDSVIASMSYGHGFSVSPLHLVAATGALVNGGFYHQPTFIKDGNQDKTPTRVISSDTSFHIRQMMRATVDIGTASRANISGLLVGGKTGSAEIVDGKNYVKGALRASFIGAFPMDNPQYIVFVMLENPIKRKDDWYYNTAGWNAVPTAGEIIKRIAPYFGIKEKEELEKQPYIDVAYERKQKQGKKK